MTDLYESLQLPSLRDDLTAYRVGISHEIGDVPLETLCLPKVINTILKREKFLRVHDLLGVDISGIKGISDTRATVVSQRMRTFFSHDL